MTKVSDYEIRMTFLQNMEAEKTWEFEGTMTFSVTAVLMIFIEAEMLL
jgi:hypothetical protein